MPPTVAFVSPRLVVGVAVKVIRPRTNREAPARLFCFPHAGGGSASFRSWVDPLWPVEVCSVQLPGRESGVGEALHTRLPDFLEVLTSALCPLLDRPFAFFGHSLGAIIAFEVTRSLRRRGWPLPVGLFVAASEAPDRIPSAQLHLLPEDALVAELRRLGGTPEPVLRDPDLRRLLLPIVRADLAIRETYAYVEEPPLPCPITMMVGSHDRQVEPADVEAWRLHTTGRARVRRLWGDHFFVTSARADVLAAVAFDLAEWLRVQPTDSGALAGPAPTLPL